MKLAGTDGKRFYSWKIEPGTYVLGRKEGNDLYLPHRTVSRRHAQLEVSPDGINCYLTDMGSHNGTLVNGEKLTDRVQLREGDQIAFGSTEFKLVADDKVPSSTEKPSLKTMADEDLQKSVFFSINEALQPLPKKATEIPELIPNLFDMARLLAADMPQDELLKKSLELISRIIPADRLAVLIPSDEEGEVYVAAKLLPSGKDPGEFTLSSTIINEIMNNKNSILIGDTAADPRFAEQKSIIMSELTSVIAVPMFDEGKVLGILYVDTTNPMHQYNDEYLRILATFGNLLASRLLNYTLQSERREKEIIDAEMKRASEIQERLLVKGPPQIEGFEVCAYQEQSRMVGGDLYDLKVLPDKSLLFLVADISGKGIGAALLMSNILASFRILYDSDSFDLLKTVQRVSKQMFQFSEPGNFATLFIGLLEPDKGKIRFINAGHNPPLFVKSDGKMDKLQPSGLMIGAFDIADWQEQEIGLSVGDMLFIYTDGVNEAQRDDEFYGEERMENLIVNSRFGTAGEISSDLMKDINKFMGNAPRTDDITMMIIKRQQK